MGAWGEEAFDNDDAADWLFELEAARDLGLVRDVLSEVAASTGPLDATDGAVAVAAAEIIAMSFGQPGPAPSSAASTWVSQHGGEVRPADARLALAALDRVEGPESELATLWSEAGDAWSTAIGNLRDRLS